MSEPMKVVSLREFLENKEEWVAARAPYFRGKAEWYCLNCGEAYDGIPPCPACLKSVGLPRAEHGAIEVPEEMLLAGIKTYHKTTAFWAPELMGSEAHIEKLVCDIIYAALNRSS